MAATASISQLLSQASLLISHTAIQLGAAIAIGVATEYAFKAELQPIPSDAKSAFDSFVIIGAQLFTNACFVAAAISVGMMPGSADPASMFVFLYTLNFTQPVLQANIVGLAMFLNQAVFGGLGAMKRKSGPVLLTPGRTRNEQNPQNLYTQM